MAIKDPWATTKAVEAPRVSGISGIKDPWATKGEETKSFSTISAPEFEKTQQPTLNYSDESGNLYFQSRQKDPYSGKPILGMEDYQAKMSRQLPDRTFPSFDFTKPQKITNDMLTNKRMPQDASKAIKESIGGTAAQELDHIMPLELGGSNTKSNLRLEAFQSGKRATATDPLENQLAHKVYKGEISVLDAWKQMAKAKGISLPEQPKTPEVKRTYETGAGGDLTKSFPSTIKTLAELQIDPLSLKADPKKAISEGWNSIVQAMTQQLPEVSDHASASEKIGKFMEAVSGVANVAFSPISALFKGAEQVPVLGSVSRLISLPFSVMGDAGPDAAKVIVDKLPISQEAKNNVVNGVGEIFALAGQLAIGKLSAEVMPRLTKTYGVEDAKTIVTEAKKMVKEKPLGQEVMKPKEVPKGTIEDITKVEPPKETSIKLASGFDPGLDKFISEDVKPLVKKIPEIGRATFNVLGTIKNGLINIFQPSLPIEKRGGEIYSSVIKAIHTPEAEMVSFDNARSRTFDENFKQLEESFSKMKKEDLEKLNLTRGNASTAEGLKIQEDASRTIDPKLKDSKIIESIKETSDYVFNLAKSKGLDINYFEDYFYGTYENPSQVKSFLEYWRSTEGYLKEKTIPTIADAKAFGLELKDQNPITNIRSELRAVATRIGLNELKETQIKDGHNYSSKIETATSEQRRLWRPINDPVFKGMLFDPEYAKFVNSLISTNKISSNLVLKGIRQASFLTQQIKFFGSIFHMRNMMKGAVSAETGGIVNPKGWADFAKSFKPIDTTTLEYKDYTNLGGGHKYSIEYQAQEQINKVIDKMSRGNYLGGLARVPSVILGSKWIPASPGFVRWMFDDMIPSLKFDKFTRDVAEKQNSLGRNLTNTEKIDIIKKNQNFYGEMNERLFGRSGTVTSALRLVFQAPGYGEGNFRVLAKSLGEVGGGVSDIFTKKKTTTGFTNSKFVMNSFVSTLVMASVGTYFATGKWPDIPKDLESIRDLFKMKTNQKDGNGDSVFFDMMSYDNDFWAVYGNLATGQPGKILPTLSQRVSGATAVGFKAMNDMSTLFVGGMVYDFRGVPIFYKTDSFTEKFSKFLNYEFTQAQPISTSAFSTAKQKGTSAIGSAAGSVAGIRPTTSEEVKTTKASQQDLFSLQDSKKQRQLDINKLYNENPDEALKQAKQFNDEQKKKLFELLKAQGVKNITNTQLNKYIIKNIKKGKAKMGTSITP